MVFWSLAEGERESEQEDFYRGSQEFFRRIFQDDEMAETVMQEFLTRTLDLPAIMKGPSITGLEARILVPGRDGGTGAKGTEAGWTEMEDKRKLDRIYLEGLLKQLEETDKKRYEKIKMEINDSGSV